MGHQNLDEFFSQIKSGEISAGNYFKIMEDGTIRLMGSATSWKDMVMDIFSKRLNGTSGKVDYDWNENAIKFQSGGSITTTIDRVQGNQEINYEFQVGSSIIFKPHIHWFQEVTSGVADARTLTMKYRLQKNGIAKKTTWTTVTCNTGIGGNDIFDFTGEVNGFYNQLSRFPDITVDCSVSDTLQFMIARTDTDLGDMLVYFFDLHGKVDSFGSDEEIAKA